MMAPGEVSPKIQLFQEPMVYLRPVLAYTPIPQISKTYSNENFFNQEAYREFRNSKNFKESGETRKDFSGKGMIMDILA